MMWALLKKVPKFALVLLVVVGSTVLFGIWWFAHSAKKAVSEKTVMVPAEDTLPKPEDIGPKLTKVESRWGELLLVGNDLYDSDGNGVIFKNWLKEENPQKLFWEPDSKTILAQYERAFVRYAVDGSKKAELVQRHPFGIADDYKWIVFAKDKDIWQATVDWKELKLTNERKVTAVEQFNDQNFAGNIFMGTEKTLVVRAIPNVLRIILETGEVKPARIPLLDIGKRRSPDSKSVVGVQNGQFYCYDVDSDDAKATPIGRGAINDYQWLDNARCVAIVAMKSVILYDRPKHTLTELAALPSQYSRIGEPSPDGRFVFCVNGATGKAALIDAEKKTATQITGGAGFCWVSKDTFAFSREVPDSELRGTWLQTVGEAERRISPSPYLVGKAGHPLLALKSSGALVFATKHGLSKMMPDGSDVREVAAFPQTTAHVIGIEEWNH
jgi:hypothetical protein